MAKNKIIINSDTLEVRAGLPNSTLGDGNTVYGRAITYEVPSDNLQFVEIIHRGAVDDELLQNSDVYARVNHSDDYIVARWNKGKGSLHLENREDGLYYSFQIPETEKGRELAEHIKRGEISSSSFSFIVEADGERWSKRNGKVYHEVDKIAYLHGKMGNNEKIEILARFKDGTCPILISTTVIELGIDIKNALGIIIFSASSFGLASLHQLRGRVGRDGQKAYCLLVDNFEDEQEKEKLKFLETCSDGYEISQKDMEMRGPGDFIGVKQSGFPTFSCLNIVSDFKMFECARDDSLYICSHLEDNECFRYYDYVVERMKKDEESIPLFD